MTQQALSVTVIVAALALAAGCGGSSSGSTKAADTTTPVPVRTHHHHPRPSVTPTLVATPTPTPTPTITVTVTSGATPTTSPAGAQNLVAGSTVRAALVAAGAQSHGLAASDYTGLVPGETYYAFDPATSTYWAGAGLVPSSSSMPAQVSVQDDGSYLLFSKSSGGGWSATNVGLAGIAGSTCPKPVPASVLKVWHWKPKTCRPPGS
jgi:hypothetical protein